MAERGKDNEASAPLESSDPASVPADEAATTALPPPPSVADDAEDVESALLGSVGLQPDEAIDLEREKTREFRYHDLIASKYRLEAAIARGGMGKVFRATQLPLGRNVALKVLSPVDRADLDFGERFLREASMLAKLQHPHIVTVHDYGRTDEDDLFMVMEYIDGLSLSRVLADGGALSVSRALRITIQTARALRAAHRAGIIHRDLKPSNIMLAMHDEDTRDFVKVVDFGLAKLFQSDDEQTASVEITGTDIMLGSPRYMAPEQIRNQAVDPRTDIYSLGVAMFYMLSGTPPYTAKSPRDIMAQHLRDPTPNLAAVAPHANIPPGLAAIVARCMAKEMNDRFFSADALIEALTVMAQELEPLSASAARIGISSVTGMAPADYTPVAASRSIAQTAYGLPSSAQFDSNAAQQASAGWRVATFIAIAVCLVLGGFALYQKADREQIARTVVIDPRPKVSDTVLVETKPTGLVLLDEEGAVLGTSPIRLPRPTAKQPLRVRIRQGAAASELFRVLVDRSGETATIDAQVWIDQKKSAEAAAEAEADPQPESIDSIFVDAPKTKTAKKRRRSSRRATRPRQARRSATTNKASATRNVRRNASVVDETPPIQSSAVPSTAVSRTAQKAPPSNPNRKGVARKPRVGIVPEKNRPEVGLVDEEEPNIGIIEE